jgi:hypothetical protein
MISIISNTLKFNKSLNMSTRSENFNKYNEYKMNAIFEAPYEV